MSGALETAASAFAIVGVVDVLLRSCREIHGFLTGVKDAPNSIIQLSNSISDTILLSEASKSCLNSLDNSLVAFPKNGAVLTLESSLKALNRETQSLRILVAKFKGDKTWGRVKYVLSDAKIAKAINRLEGNKSLLSAALTLACNELSIRGHAATEIAVRQHLQQVDRSIQDLSGILDQRLNAQTTTVSTALDTYYDKTIALQSKGQQNILSTITAQNSTRSKSNTDNQQAIMSRISTARQEASEHQKELRRLTKRNFHQGSSLNQKLDRSIQLSRRQHSETKDSIVRLTSEIRQIGVSTGPKASVPMPYDRYIIFLGQHSDMIMTYLLPMQHDLNHAIGSLINDQGSAISVNHAYWLRREFGRLIASAAQENAARFRVSTAQSIDQWSYPVELKSGTDTVSEQNHVIPEFMHRPANRKQGSYVKPSNQLWSLETPSGAVHISLPPAQPGQGGVASGSETGASWTITQNCSTFAVSAHFRRFAIGSMQPRTQTQFSVFMRVEDLFWKYWHLFGTGTISDIDFAYRNGTISPFHVDDTGSNYWFEAAINRTRPDALLYLLNHGIRTSQLIRALGPAKSQQLCQDEFLYSDSIIIRNPRLQSLIEHIGEEAPQPSSIFANVALNLCIQAYARRDWGSAWTLFYSCGQVLLRDRPDLEDALTKYWLIGNERTPILIWNDVPPKQLLSLIFAAGASPQNVYPGDRDAIAYFMLLHFSRTNQDFCEAQFRTDVDVLNALVEYIPPCEHTLVEVAIAVPCFHEWLDALDGKYESVLKKALMEIEICAISVEFDDDVSQGNDDEEEEAQLNEEESGEEESGEEECDEEEYDEEEYDDYGVSIEEVEIDVAWLDDDPDDLQLRIKAYLLVLQESLDDEESEDSDSTVDNSWLDSDGQESENNDSAVATAHEYWSEGRTYLWPIGEIS